MQDERIKQRDLNFNPKKNMQDERIKQRYLNFNPKKNMQDEKKKQKVVLKEVEHSVLPLSNISHDFKQKVVLKVFIEDDRTKQKAMKKVSSLPGVDSVSMDMKDMILTVTGDMDPVTVVSKLRKICFTDVVYVGPAKEPEKKTGDDKKKEDAKKKEEEALKLTYHAAAAYNHYHPNNQPYPYYNYQQQPQAYYIYQPPPQTYNQYTQPPISYYYKVANEETPSCVIS